MAIISALLLPCGTGVLPEPVLLDTSDHRNISRLLGVDLFDVLAHHVQPPSNPALAFTLVAYFDDEGNYKDYGDSDPINYLAAALLADAIGDCIVGPVLLVSGTNPDGVYDGECYDLPEWLTTIEAQKGITYTAIALYERYMQVLADIVDAADDGIIDLHEFNTACEEVVTKGDAGRYADVCDMINMAQNYNGELKDLDLDAEFQAMIDAEEG